MFKKPFSFYGRIRRLEYGLSYIFYIMFYVILSLIWESLQSGDIIFYLLFMVMIWFLLAQGAKRCHDLGQSGFFQFIPFYGLLMLFQDGEKWDNKYGRNPKLSDETKEISSAPEPKTPVIRTLLHLSVPILSNILFAAILIEYLPVSDFLVGFVVLCSVIIFYFLALLINYKNFPFPSNRKEVLSERMLYATLFYLGVRLYTICFTGTEVNFETIFLEIFLVGFVLGLTYLPFILFKTLVKKPSLQT